MSLKPDNADQRFLRRLLLTIVVVALAYFAYHASDLLLLAFGATLVGILLSAIADALHDYGRLPRGWGLAVAALLLFAGLGAIGWLFASETARQTHRLAQTLPQDWQKVQAMLDASSIGKMLLDSARSITGGKTFASVLLGAGWGAIEILVNFIIVLIGGIFFAADPALYRRGILLLIPRSHRDSAERALDDTGEALRLWLLTQIISMAAMGVMITIGLRLSGQSSSAALGALGGLSEFIPYVGPTLAMMPAIIIAAAGGGSIWGTIATYIIVRVVQTNLLTPLVSQRVVSVPPGLYIFLILAMGFGLGRFGLFFAGALAVAAFTLVRRLYLAEVLGEHIPTPSL